MAEVVEVLVDGGKASAGPPLGPALGPLGVNVGKVVGAINEKTKAFVGMKVPVKLTINPKTKDFEIEVGTPPTTALVKKELGIESGSGNPLTTFVGSLTVDQAKNIAKMKCESLMGASLKNQVREVVGTCQSMGVRIDSKKPQEFLKAMDEGLYDKHF